MKKLISIFIFFLSLTVTGQLDKNEIRDKAFSFYIDNKYDSAVVYYKQVIELTDENRTTYYYRQLGDCFIKLNDYKKAKESYLKCITDTSNNRVFSSNRDCYQGLIDIYIEEKNYNEALKYLRLADSKYPHIGICSNGELEQDLRLNYKYSQCFKELDQIDSAIAYLTPYVFVEPENLLMDSLEYMKINTHYIDLLNQRYNEIEIKKEISSAIENIYYKKEIDIERNKKYPNEEFYNVLCYITFLGQSITLVDGGYEANSWGGEPVEQYTEEFLINYFKNTPTFQILTK